MWFRILILHSILLKIMVKSKLIDLNGRKLTVISRADGYPPSFRIIINGNITTYAGAEVALVSYIAKALNFSFQVVPFNEGVGVYANGVWTGLIGKIARKEADIAVGVIGARADRMQVVDFSWPFGLDGVCLTSHKPVPLDFWQALTWPFQMSVWLGILATFICFSIFIWLASKWILQDRNFDIVDGFTAAIQSMLGQGYSSRNQSNLYVNLAIVLWLMYCFIIDATFSGNLTSSLTVPKKSEPLDTFKQLADSSFYELAVQKGNQYQQLFEQSTDLVFRKIGEKLKTQKNKYESEDEKFEMMKNPQRVTLSYCSVEASAANCSSFTGNTYLHVSKEFFRNTVVAHPIQKGAPYLNDYNRLVRRALYFGLYAKWIEDDFRMSRAEIVKQKLRQDKRQMAIEQYVSYLEDNNKIRVLSLDMLQSAFFLLMFGCVASSLVFIIEMYAQKCSRVS